MSSPSRHVWSVQPLTEGRVCLRTLSGFEMLTVVRQDVLIAHGQNIDVWRVEEGGGEDGGEDERTYYMLDSLQFSESVADLLESFEEPLL